MAEKSVAAFGSKNKFIRNKTGWMTEEQFQAEKMYYISLSIVRSMLEKGIIDKETLELIDTRLLEKYHPVSATLLAGKPYNIFVGTEG